jgi:hypothetical protein
MKRTAQQELAQPIEQQRIRSALSTDPLLPIDLIGYIFVSSFKTKKITERPPIIQDQIRRFCLVNKSLCAYICQPDTIRTILNNVNYYLRDSIATLIGTPHMCNYLEKSKSLYDKIDTLTVADMRDLVKNGADVNYHITYIISRPPLLLKTIQSYDKTYCLLELGANPHLTCFDLLSPDCAFIKAIRKENIDIVNLFIQYYPYYHSCGVSSIDIALDTKNITLIKSVLTQKNIPLDKLRKVLFYAFDEDIAELREFLCDRGICMTCPTACPAAIGHSEKNTLK